MIANPPIHVAAGAIEDGCGRILIARRPDGVHQGGLWEFPGGKLEPGETPEQGLARELAEELGIRVTASRPLIRVRHDYGDKQVLLDVHRVSAYQGRVRGREGQPIDWVRPDDMAAARFPAADRPIIGALRLPEVYLITGPEPTDAADFLGRLERALDSGIALVQLRAHALSDPDYARLAERAEVLCARFGAKLILSGRPDLVARLPVAGMHLRCAALRSTSTRPLPHDRLVGASCHNSDDLVLAGRLGLDYALLSPVRRTLSHPDARPLGWRQFRVLVEPASVPVYALGGVGRQDLDSSFRHGGQGIAAIRGLWPGPGHS